MSNLRKTLRALHHSEEWRETIEAACILKGVENTQDLQVVVTNALSDQIVFNEDTLEIDVSGVDDETLLEAVAAYEPPLGPEDAKPVDMSTFAQIDAAITGFTMKLLEDTGREMGKPWQQPAGAHDAYPKGWIALHDGKSWESLVPYNVWEPGVSGWREIPSEDSIPAWQQPTGAHDAYKTGDTVTTADGQQWQSTVDNNVWRPGVYGWTLG